MMILSVCVLCGANRQAKSSDRPGAAQWCVPNRAVSDTMCHRLISRLSDLSTHLDKPDQGRTHMPVLIDSRSLPRSPRTETVHIPRELSCLQSNCCCTVQRRPAGGCEGLQVRRVK